MIQHLILRRDYIACIVRANCSHRSDSNVRIVLNKYCVSTHSFGTCFSYFVKKNMKSVIWAGQMVTVRRGLNEYRRRRQSLS